MDHRSVKYPYVRGRGPLEAALACFQMLNQRRAPFRIVIVILLIATAFPSGVVPLQNVELKFSMVNVPAVAVSRRTSSDAQVAR